MSNEDLTYENEVKQSATTEIESLKKQKQFQEGSVRKLASIIVENKKIIKDKAEIEQQHKKLNGELMVENNQLRNRIKELDNSLSIALSINDKYQRENKELKEDNKKLAQQIQDLDKVKELRSKGLI